MPLPSLPLVTVHYVRNKGGICRTRRSSCAPRCSPHGSYRAFDRGSEGLDAAICDVLDVPSVYRYHEGS